MVVLVGFFAGVLLGIWCLLEFDCLLGLFMILFSVGFGCHFCFTWLCLLICVGCFCFIVCWLC